MHADSGQPSTPAWGLHRSSSVVLEARGMLAAGYDGVTYGPEIPADLATFVFIEGGYAPRFERRPAHDR
ncbi:hypothetical protein GGR61_001895 [Xanthomonas arboricola]|nr:hypothetical protein [Xanthomonas sp. 3058]